MNSEQSSDKLNDKEIIEESGNSTKKDIAPPGELYFTIFLTIMTIILAVQSIPLKGILTGNTSGPGVLPQLITLLLIISISIIIIQQFVKRKSNNRIKDTIAYLFIRENIIVLGLIILYGMGLYFIGYTISTFIFIWIASYLLKRGDLIKKGIVSLVFTIIITLVFEKGFLIMLP